MKFKIVKPAGEYEIEECESKGYDTREEALAGIEEAKQGRKFVFATEKLGMLTDTMKANADNKEREGKDRDKANSGVKRSYRLKKD